MDKIVHETKRNDNLFANNHNQSNNIVMRKNLRTKMKTVISSLSEKQRLIITLYFYEKLSANDISKLLRMSEYRISKILNETLSLINKKVFLEN